MLLNVFILLLRESSRGPKMSQLPTSAQVKQGARQLFSVATDKVKVVSANVQRGDTSVRINLRLPRAVR